MPPKNNRKIPEAKCTEALIFSDPTLVTLPEFFQSVPPLLKEILGRPILDFMIDNLSSNKVDDITIACTSHYDKISSYCEKFTAIKISILDFSGLTFVDALNKIGKLSLFSGNFYLLNGPIISNLPLSNYFTFHKERQRKDSSFCVSAFFDTKKFVKNPKNPQILIQRISDHEIIDVISGNSDIFAADVHSILQNGVEIVDEPNFANILIADPLIFELASEHFDKRDCEEFLYTLIATGAILGRKVGSLMIDKLHYAAQLFDSRAQLRIDHDLRAGLIWPFSPENNYEMESEAPFFDAGKSTVYAAGSLIDCEADDAYFGADSVANISAGVKNSVIGRGSKLAKTAQVQGSILGENCLVIGKLIDCAVENDVIIEESASYSNKFITRDAVLDLCSATESLVIEYPPFSVIAREDADVIAARERAKELASFDRDMKKIVSILSTVAKDQLSALSTEIRTLCATANLFDITATFWSYLLEHIFAASINKISQKDTESVKESAVKSMNLFSSTISIALELNKFLASDPEAAIYEFLGPFQSFIVKKGIDSISAQSALNFLLSKNLVSREDFEDWFEELEEVAEEEDKAFLELIDTFYRSILGEEYEYEYEEYEEVSGEEYDFSDEE